ncbi:MAG: L-seryl-tRNA(Sec) selenium transferase [Desulfobacterales bacterium]|nr:L-seryl-tRNA(Sec) selenium transferase [Desulfobacterales bacterium]MCP4159952.1 L-seryl-tRNA(Sec) selenium transferase [Deltaproteobacteria bacterium]
MQLNNEQKNMLKLLPGVDNLLEEFGEQDFYKEIPKSVLTSSIREIIEKKRAFILAGEDVSIDGLQSEIQDLVQDKTTPNLVNLINATGVVVHTNLGRSLLPEAALKHMSDIASGYSNLEFDIESGKRGSRYSIVEDIICEISGAEAAMVVNNNASAVLLALETIASGKEVIVSRGELVEIGGSFRIPDIMAKSGGILKEVGATNRTHRKDYENEINEETGLLLKVHTSNYSIVGFTSSLSLEEMVSLGKERSITVMEDLGSGTFVDFSKYGLQKEPTVQESVKAGVDLITFSGDKLLGGPQAGIIIGKKEIIDEIKKNPFTRAVRIDKLTLAALEIVMRFYRDERAAVSEIPTLKMLFMKKAEIEARAAKVSIILTEKYGDKIEVSTCDTQSKAGGGSLPLMLLPSSAVTIKVPGKSASYIEKKMRYSKPSVIGRIENDNFLLDLRTVSDKEVESINNAVANILEKKI